MKPRPSNFFGLAGSALNEINKLEPQLKHDINQLGDATRVYHVAVTMKDHCIDNDKLDDAQEWDAIEQALVTMGVSDFIAVEMERRKVEREEQRKVEAEKKHLQMEKGWHRLSHRPRHPPQQH